MPHVLDKLSSLWWKCFPVLGELFQFFGPQLSEIILFLSFILCMALSDSSLATHTLAGSQRSCLTKKAKFTVSQPWKLKVQKSKYQQDLFLLRALREGFILSLSPSLVYRWPSSPYTFTSSSLYVPIQISFFYEDTSHTGLEATQYLILT